MLHATLCTPCSVLLGLCGLYGTLAPALMHQLSSVRALHLIPRSSTLTHSYSYTRGYSPTPVFLLSCSRRENEERARKRKSILAKKLCHTLICLLRQTPHFVSAPEYVAGRLRKKTEKREKKLDISRVGWQKMTPTRAASGFRFA